MGTALVQAPRVNLHFACFQMEIRPSNIHRYGVCALERIPPRRKVIEYTGERISRREAKRRDQEGDKYLFALDAYWTIDGAVGGSGAEIINHSCEPNLISRVIRGHILYMSLREIEAGEELTVNYQFERQDGLMACWCGAKSCKGVMKK